VIKASLITIIFFFVFPQTGYSFSEKILEKWENGNRKIQYSLAHLPGGKSVKTGKYFSWHQNGEKSLETHYANGLENGKHTEWDENGQNTLEVKYVKGKKEGVEKVWYSNGVLRLKSNYRAGAKSGELNPG